MLLTLEEGVRVSLHDSRVCPRPLNGTIDLGFFLVALWQGFMTAFERLRLKTFAFQCNWFSLTDIKNFLKCLNFLLISCGHVYLWACTCQGHVHGIPLNIVLVIMQEDYIETDDKKIFPLRWTAPELVTSFQDRLLTAEQTKYSNIW